MPSGTDAIRAFIRRFNPEWTRAVFLNPDRHGNRLTNAFLSAESDRLWSDGTEVLAVDARSRDMNRLILADFFDFT
jgi:hypothetical protein